MLDSGSASAVERQEHVDAFVLGCLSPLLLVQVPRRVAPAGVTCSRIQRSSVFSVIETTNVFTGRTSSAIGNVDPLALYQCSLFAPSKQSSSRVGDKLDD